MVKCIKKNGLAVFLITVLVIVLSACTKEEIIHKKIAGTWCLINDPTCRWTFNSGSLYINSLSINDTIFKNIDFAYEVDNNTLILSNGRVDGYGNEATSYLSIDYISKNRLCVSGTLRIALPILHGGYTYKDDVSVNYEFQKPN